MKLHAIVYLDFLMKKGIEQAVVEGTIHAPDRPSKGDLIYWPYGEETIECPTEQDCSLLVIASDFHTEAPGKITPRIYLQQHFYGEPEKALAISVYCQWESVFQGIRHLILNPVVAWPKEMKPQPWPSSASFLPRQIKDCLTASS